MISYFKYLLVAICYLIIIKIPLDRGFLLFTTEETSKFLKIILIGSFIIVGYQWYSQKKKSIFWRYQTETTASYIPLLLPFIFPGVLAYSSFDLSCESNLLYLVYITVGFLIKGICEEAIFRGVILDNMLHKNIGKKYINVVLYSSIIFSIAHFANFYFTDLMGVLSQVAYSFMISILFSAIYINTKSVYLTGIAHGFLNIFFTNCDVSANETTPESYSVLDYFSKIFKLILIFSPLFLLYFFSMKRFKRIS